MLNHFDLQWPELIASIVDEIHPVDRDAVRIWFAMHPLIVEELADAEVFFQLRGKYRLLDTVDTSHAFLFGHRYWPAVKQALQDAEPPADLRAAVLETAIRSGAPLEFSLGMAAIGWMTLRQCGPAFLQGTALAKPAPATAEDFLKRRATAFAPGLLERMKGKIRTERIIFDEQKVDGWFPILKAQEITGAAEQDKRPFHRDDDRCYEGMGAIPVDCRSGSCGTCWIGILGGNENLEAAEDFERKRMEYFGYWNSSFVDGQTERPLLRLACQVRAHGSASIVIPSWNGVFGESRRERETRPSS